MRQRDLTSASITFKMWASIALSRQAPLCPHENLCLWKVPLPVMMGVCEQGRIVTFTI